MAAVELLQLTSRAKEVDDQWFDKNDNDEDTDSDNESYHKKLLKNIKSLDRKNKTKRHKGPLRSESTNQFSEFHLEIKDDDRVELDDLVGSLQTSSYHSKLKKTLESMQKMGKTVDVPLAKSTADRIQRVVAYEEASKDITKWEPTVQKNRQAEHLSFPLDSYKPAAMSTGTLTSFKPQTPLEQEIANVLRSNSQVLERNNKELSQEEEAALKTMSLEEALERRKELQKLRALQSYYEQKCRRIKKIKSRKYHRIKRRAEKRAASKQTFEQLQEENPELAKTELEKAERLRVAERMSLKHRNTSKWAKNVIARGIKDVQTRQALAEQLRISRQLTESKTAQTDSDDVAEDNTEAHPTENDSNMRNFGLVGDDTENPWLLNDGKTNAKGDREDEDEGQDNSKRRIRKLQSITAEDTKKGDESDETGDDDDTEHSEEDEMFELMDNSEDRTTARKGKKRKRKKLEEKKNNVEMNARGKAMKSKKKETKDKGNAKRKSSQEMNCENKTKKKRKKSKVNNPDMNEDIKIEDKQEDGKLLMENDGTEMVEQELKGQQNQTNRKMEDISTVSKKAVNLNPKKVFQIEDLGKHSGPLASSDNDDDDEERRAQRMTIQEAFANDDVIEEFIKEKEDAVEAGKPKDLDLSLPGWGDWGGPGVDETKRKKKFVVPAKPTPPRKDAKLAHVIINEERDKKFSKNQVTSVPFPYTSRDQWERSIRAPLGQHWNTTSVHHKLVQPRVTTLPGTIIDPIKPTKDIQRTRSVDDSADSRHGGKRRVETLNSGIKIHA